MEALPFDPEAHRDEEREKKIIRIKAFGPHWHVTVGGVKVAKLHTKLAAKSYAAMVALKYQGILKLDE